MRKWGEGPSAERSDTRGCGSRIAPTGASEARSRYSGDAASRRGWRAKDAGAPPRGTVAKPRALSTRRTRPEVPRAALFWAVSRAEPTKIRRVAQDCDPKAYMYMSSGRKDARIGHFSWYPPTTEGRSPRSGCPSRGASTVAPTVAARCQANQHRKSNEHHRSWNISSALAPHVRNSGLRRVSRRACGRN